MQLNSPDQDQCSNSARPDERPIQGWATTPYTIPIIFAHLLATLAVVPWFFSWAGFILCIAGVLIFGQGINLGYHRLLTHRSLTVPKWLERIYVMLAMCCMEESPAKWVSTHRMHHAHSDEPDDPHSPTETFFWAHMGWLITRKPNKDQLQVHIKYAGDILKDRFYRYLESAWWFALVLFAVQMAVMFVSGYAYAFWMELGTEASLQFGLSLMIWTVFVRTVVVWHITWSVNSLGHVFGYRNYETNEKSRNNWLVALLASGEGWHNNHHHDPASASVQHRWWEFDVTYYQILLLEKIGLAKDVVRPRHIRHQTRGVKGKQQMTSSSHVSQAAETNSDEGSRTSTTKPIEVE